MNFIRLWSVSHHGPSAQCTTTLTNKLQRHSTSNREIWIIYKKKHFIRNFQNPKKFWKSEKNWNSGFQNFEKIDLIILPNRSNRSNRKKSLNRLDRLIGQRINTPFGKFCWNYSLINTLKLKKNPRQSLIFLPPPSFLFPSATGESNWDPEVFIIIIIIFPFWWLSYSKHFISHQWHKVAKCDQWHKVAKCDQNVSERKCDRDGTPKCDLTPEHIREKMWRNTRTYQKEHATVIRAQHRGRRVGAASRPWSGVSANQAQWSFTPDQHWRIQQIAESILCIHGICGVSNQEDATSVSRTWSQKWC